MNLQIHKTLINEDKSQVKPKQYLFLTNEYSMVAE